MLARPPIAEITRTIAERFQPARIVVFGSYARGNASEDSDLDLFVELDSPLRPAQRAAAIASVFGLRSWAMDLIVYTPAEVERERGRFGSLMATIEREGHTVYDRRRGLLLS